MSAVDQVPSDEIINTLFGRRKIFTNVEEITPLNVINEINNVLSLHIRNLREEEYLYWYRRGLQPILNRTKEVRPEINNKVVVNNANQVVVFKNGYFLTKPAFYISRKEDEETAKKVKDLNEFLYLSGKQTVDNKVVNWFHTVGVGVVYVEPNKKGDIKKKPVNVYALDPRSAFVVYSLRPGNKPVMGVNIVTVDNQVFIDVYTETHIFHLSGGITGRIITDRPLIATATALDGVEKNQIGAVPIIEYIYNDNRTGAFETAISIMDEINNIESNRADGVELAVQQLCVAYNCNFDDGITANDIRQAGMICLKSIGENKADFKILESTLDQTATQTTLDDLYNQMLEKCGVPSSNRDAGSTSDNVGAVYLRSGWATADTDCRNTEDLFKESNKLFDEIFLKVLKQSVGFEIDPNDFELCFPRTDMNNLLAKVQAAQGMKELGFSPELAFERSGLSNDALNDVEVSKKYIEMKWNVQADMPALDSAMQMNNKDEEKKDSEESATKDEILQAALKKMGF